MRATTALLAVLLALPLSACSDQQESYCDALAEEKQTLADLSARSEDNGKGVLSESIDVFERLRDEAPDDVADEWTTYVIAWQSLEDALSEAGADESAFTEGKKPEGMSDAEYDAISDAATKLRSLQVVEAAAGIEQHAMDVCKVDLSGSVAGP